MAKTGKRATDSRAAWNGRPVNPTQFWVADWHRRVSDDVKWRAEPVIGETTRSWILGPSYDPRKIPKAGPWPMHGVCRSEAECEARRWAAETLDSLRRALSQTQRMDVDVVAAVARTFGVAVPPHVARFLSGEQGEPGPE
jgi:hypothetical protein